MILFFLHRCFKENTLPWTYCFSMLSERASLKYTLESCNIENYLFCRPSNLGRLAKAASYQEQQLGKLDLKSVYDMSGNR